MNNKLIYYKNVEGNFETAEVVLYFSVGTSPKKYITYTKNELGENDYVELFSSIVEENESETVFAPIASDEEWDMVKVVMKDAVHSKENIELPNFEVLNFSNNNHITQDHSRKSKVKNELKTRMSSWYNIHKPEENIIAEIEKIIPESKIDNLVSTLDEIKNTKEEKEAVVTNTVALESAPTLKSEDELERFYEATIKEAKNKFLTNMEKAFDELASSFKESNVVFTQDIMNQLFDTSKNTILNMESKNKELEAKVISFETKENEYKSVIENQQQLISKISEGQVIPLNNEVGNGESGTDKQKVLAA